MRAVAAALLLLAGTNAFAFDRSCELTLSAETVTRPGLSTDNKIALLWGELEKFWTAELKTRGVDFKPPQLVLYSMQTTTQWCGLARWNMGPFYCPPDHKVYYDPSFTKDLYKKFGLEGDGVLAYILAHEFAHHIFETLGLLDEKKILLSQPSLNDETVFTTINELAADGFAGFFFAHLTKMKRADLADIGHALQIISNLSDDTVAKLLHLSPEQVTGHGTSAQRTGWFRRGWQADALEDINPFQTPDLLDGLTPDVAKAITQAGRYPGKLPAKPWFHFW
jgi:predicted metalloprotease